MISFPWHALGRVYHGLATAAGYGVLAAIGTGITYDLWLNVNSLEMQSQVQELAALSSKNELLAGPETQQDFDGDGAFDSVTVVDHIVQGAFSGYTPKLLRVHSGRTQELLFAKRIFRAQSFEGWCADKDGNGTVELVIGRRRHLRVFGYVKDAQ